MSQNSNKKTIDKNFKLMAVSATILVILVIYTLYNNTASVQSSLYYLGIGILLLLLFLLIKLNKDKLVQIF